MKGKKNLPSLLFIIGFIACMYPNTAFGQREMKTLSSGWLFAKGEQPDTAAYTSVSIPHTWNTDAYTDKNYYRGIAWYRKTIAIPSQWREKQLFLRFEAVSKSADVYVNGKLAGQHKGGYTAFTIDITPFCSSTSATHTIALRVDNAREDIPPISGDFTFFGGIYRDVWLIATPKQHLHLSNYGSDGIYISTPQVSAQAGSLVIQGEVKNDATEKAKIEIEHILFAPDGKIVRTINRAIALNAGELYRFTEKPVTVSQPLLWSPEQPHIYRVETKLRDKKSRRVIDRTSHYTGFRWFHFDGEKGFSLNGKPYKLNGICRHQDQKPFGVAMSDEMHRRDMLLMKEMGANFIRISHYPQDPAILEQCDKLGMLAWEEIPIIDIVPDSEEYANTCEENLREMIRQHYNHPSIITWGYMNEILLVAQRRYKTAQTLKPVQERTLALAKRLEKVLKEEDPYRSSTMAFHGSNAYNEVGLANITDVIGWNLYSGWYGGEFSGFEKFLEKQHTDHPTHPIIVSEYGAGSDKRLHSLQPESFDFSIEYQQMFLEHYLSVIGQTPYVCGGTHWNFIDFASALRDESMPRLNNKGLVYTDRTPKDVFYLYKATFRKDIPVLHIASRDWTYRCGIQNKTGEEMQPVKIYTNLPVVELFINGKSAGKKESTNQTVVFNVPFQTGTHFLRATGEANGKTVEDGVSIHFKSIPKLLSEENLKGLELAVNVGSNCYFTSDDSRLTWVPDQAYQPGSWGYLSDKDSRKEGTQTEIKNTTDGPLYQTLRSNLKGYRFDVPQGEYEIELLLADIFGTSEKIPYQLGKDQQPVSMGNIFRIYINDQLVEEACCPQDETGAFHAIRKRFISEAKDNHIEIRFETINGKNFLNGIKLRKL